MSSELSPCPFCGDKRVALHYESDPDGFGKFHMVRCHACGAQSRGVFASTGNDCPLHYEEVREAWNRRATPPSPAIAGPVTDGWMPIETAPKDGKDIPLSNGKDVSIGEWLYDEGGTREYRDAEGHYIGQDDRDGFEGWVDWSGGMLPEPTHWMPLPAAPGDAVKTGEAAS